MKIFRPTVAAEEFSAKILRTARTPQRDSLGVLTGAAS
jgi:hypothetical protein